MNIINSVINQEIIKQIQLNYANIPLVVFLLGTNGSGKSSLRNYLNLSDIQSNIDPDVMNRIYSAKYPQAYHIEAGRQALKMYDETLASGLNVCLESTLAGHGTMQRIIRAKQLGYFTIAYYVGLNSVELNLERIAIRVAGGGHNIPELTVRRRYNELPAKLASVKNYFDIIHVVDNSENYFRLQYSVLNQDITKYCKEQESWASNLLRKLF